MSESKSHDGEGFRASVRRFFNNWEDLFDRHTASRGRPGWYDLIAQHAGTNVCVSACREFPRTSGHVWFIQTMVSVVLLLPLAGYGLWRLVAG